LTFRLTEEEFRALGLKEIGSNNVNRKAEPSRPSGNPGPLPEPERTLRREREESNPLKKVGTKCFEIRVISYRSRFADPDNMCPKVWIDELVSLGYLPADDSRVVAGVTKKVELCFKEDERTEIEIWEVEW